MKFGARLCFYTCVSFCLRGGKLASQHASQAMTGGVLSACIQGASASSRVCVQGVCIQGIYIHRGLHPTGICIQGGLGGWTDIPWDSMGYGQQVGGRHPTGMHSCCCLCSIFCSSEFGVRRCAWPTSFACFRVKASRHFVM